MFIAHQMNSVFLWSTGICCDTQCIRNQHSQFFLLEVKGLGVPFRLQVHVLSTRRRGLIRASCGHGAPISNSIVRELSGLVVKGSRCGWPPRWVWDERTKNGSDA